MIAALLALTLAAPSLGDDAPSPQACAAVYQALGEVQLSVNANEAVLARRFSNYPEIDFATRARDLAVKLNDPGLIQRTEGLEAAYYVRLIGAQNADEPNSPDMKDIGDLEQACDRAFDFEPSLAR